MSGPAGSGAGAAPTGLGFSVAGDGVGSERGGIGGAASSNGWNGTAVSGGTVGTPSTVSAGTFLDPTSGCATAAADDSVAERTRKAPPNRTIRAHDVAAGNDVTTTALDSPSMAGSRLIAPPIDTFVVSRM